MEHLAFVEYVRYDEATSIMGVEQSNLPNLFFNGVDGAGVEQAERVLIDESITETSLAKVFQTEDAWGALLKVTTAAWGPL